METNRIATRALAARNQGLISTLSPFTILSFVWMDGWTNAFDLFHALPFLTFLVNYALRPSSQCP